MSQTKKPDRCRFCSHDTEAVVRTNVGFSRVCETHIANFTNPLNITWLAESATPPMPAHNLDAWDAAKKMHITECAETFIAGRNAS
jgi:hypothetical protein